MPAERIDESLGVYNQANFGRVITAMVTPFYEDGSLNFDMAQELAASKSDDAPSRTGSWQGSFADGSFTRNRTRA